MSVRQRDLSQDAEQARGAALFSRNALARQQTATERFVAFLLLLVSFIGIILFGGGGAGQWLQFAPSWAGAVSALVVQVVCTRVQWVYAAARWHSPWWLIAFGVSTIGTLLGFWPLAHPALVGVLSWAQVPTASAPLVAGATLIVGAGLLDYLPEQILTS